MDAGAIGWIDSTSSSGAVVGDVQCKPTSNLRRIMRRGCCCRLRLAKGQQHDAVRTQSRLLTAFHSATARRAQPLLYSTWKLYNLTSRVLRYLCVNCNWKRDIVKCWKGKVNARSCWCYVLDRRKLDNFVSCGIFNDGQRVWGYKKPEDVLSVELTAYKGPRVRNASLGLLTVSISNSAQAS